MSTSPALSQKLREGDTDGAYAVLSDADALPPAVCGRVCPQETQCEAKCMRGIKGEPVGIGRLERFDGGLPLKNPGRNRPKSPNPTATRSPSSARVPRGSRAPASLPRMGYDVTVFEALHVAGGVLVYGIPRVPSAEGDRAAGS